MYFKNRRDAGQQLSLRLANYKNKDVVVYALPRGGVVVAVEIARYLKAPLDLLLAHKIGHPHSREYAVAAVSESGHIVGTPQELQALGPGWLEEEKKEQMEEIKRKRRLYLKGRPDIPVKDKIAIVVDDGIATGLTMLVGIKELKDRHPQKIVVAVPVSPKSTADLLKKTVDDVVGLEIADYFHGAVGAYYEEFDQVEDEEVISILDSYAKETKNPRREG